MLTYLRNDLHAKICPTVKHCHDDAAELEALVCAGIVNLLYEANNFY